MTRYDTVQKSTDSLPVRIPYYPTTMPQQSRVSSELMFTAYRAAFVATLDALLRDALDQPPGAERTGGFLASIPLLDGVAPQIQMELLLHSWQRGHAAESGIGDENTRMLDELIKYAAFECLAGFTRTGETALLKKISHDGDGKCPNNDIWLHSKACCAQLAGVTRISSSLIHDLISILDTPEPADVRPSGMSESRVSEGVRDVLISLSGRWVARKEILFCSEGLLTADEQDLLRMFFEEHPGLVR